jgi:DNA polymerase/3'-5' exonuclease PolX
MFNGLRSLDLLIKHGSTIKLNMDVSQVLKELADLQDNIWKGTAYEKASRVIEDLEKPITDFDDFEDIPGIGRDIAQEIGEFLDTGYIEKLERMKQKRDPRRKFTREQVLQKTKDFFDSADEAGLKYTITGSVRRKVRFIKDIDSIILSEQFGKWERLVDKMAEEVLRKGKSEIDFMFNGIAINMRASSSDSWGAALLYFSGSDHFVIYLRQLAKSRGYKLNRYGLFTKAGEPVAQETEKEIFEALDLPYIPPEER